jgi:hypothetical protein
MASNTSPTRRLLLAGGFAAAVVAAPLIAAVGAAVPGDMTPAASCPTGEVLDTASGACKPATDKTPTTQNPIDPENVPLQPGSVTSSRPGDVGSLPEVNGIPCTGGDGGGGSTSECIGLEQNQSNYKQPHSSVNGQTVAPGS